MQNFLIAVASTADIPLEYLQEHNIEFISYTYTLDGEIYEDDCREESRQEAYAKMRQGKVYTTSMINTNTYYEFFKDLMAQGKDVIYLDMSKEMSSSYISLQQASRMIAEEFPGNKLYAMDTRCISGGLGLLVEHMVRRKEEGMSFEETIRWGEENKLKIMHRFTVDDLNYLKRGGRVSNASALVGSLLSIKPVLYVPDEGTLVASSKARGRKAAICALVDGMKRDMENPDGQEIHINHADCLADAESLKEQILEAFPTVKSVHISNLGIIIGSHCGPGLLTVFYFGNKRQK